MHRGAGGARGEERCLGFSHRFREDLGLYVAYCSGLPDLSILLLFTDFEFQRS